MCVLFSSGFWDVTVSPKLICILEKFRAIFLPISGISFSFCEWHFEEAVLALFLGTLAVDKLMAFMDFVPLNCIASEVLIAGFAFLLTGEAGEVFAWHFLW